MGKDKSGKKNLGPGISQRPNGDYHARFVNKYGKRISIYDKKLSEVKRKLRQARYEDENGLQVSGNKMLVRDWATTFMSIYKCNIRQTTRKTYYARIKIMNKYIGQMYLTDVRQINIVEMINELHNNGYSNGTIKGVKSITYSLFQRALENKYILNNPVVNTVVSFEEINDKEKALTREQQRIFLLSIEDSHYKELFTLMLVTGLRISEALALTWREVNWEEKTLRIERNFVSVKIDGSYTYAVHPTKTKSSRRVIPLCEKAIECLQCQKEKNLNVKYKGNLYDDLIFLSRAGKSCSFNNISKILKSKAKALKNQGYDFPHLSSHMLRHTFATRCHENGMSLKAISMILGHSKIEVTADIYTHITPESASLEIKKLDISKLEMIENDEI